MKAPRRTGYRARLSAFSAYISGHGEVTDQGCEEETESAWFSACALSWYCRAKAPRRTRHAASGTSEGGQICRAAVL